VAAPVLDQVVCARDHRAAFGRARDGDAAAAAEVEEPFVAQDPECPEHRVAVHAEDGGQVAGRWQAVAGRRLAVRYRPSDLRRDLLVQLRGVVAVQVDSQHGASHTSFILINTDTDTDTNTNTNTDTRTPTDPLEALFEEARARARRRRRRRVVAAVVLLAVGAVAVVVLTPAGERHSVLPGQPAPLAVAPGTLLARAPYMGVSCSRPSSIACDRVGLAVWTRHPARAVSASMGGRSFALGDRAWSGPARHGARRMFAGFLTHAGLRGGGPLAVRVEDGRDRWTGVHPVDAPVRLTMTYADGSRRTTVVRVALSPGWG
jgi:hypothetical protein